MKKTTLHFLAFTGAVLLTSCGSNSTNNANAALPDSAKTETSAQAPASSSSNTSIAVTLTGGSMDGTYKASCDGCCSYGIAGDNTFGTQYSETDKADKELSSVQLIVKNVNTGHTSTKSFTLTVGFGKLMASNGKSFNIMTDGQSKGSGTADIDYSGDKATVAIKGISAEGAAIDLKMECGKITTMANIGK